MRAIILCSLLLLAATTTASAQCSSCQQVATCPYFRYDSTSVCEGRPIEARLQGSCLVWVYKGTNQLVPAGSRICLQGRNLEAIRQGLLVEKSTGVYRDGKQLVSGFPKLGFQYKDMDVFVQNGKDTIAVLGSSGGVSFVETRDKAETLIAKRDGKDDKGELVAKK